ncbi:hypothetical protein Nepgr_030551 [Nepenthes gracilis]|uniref:Uncharacterized protein n=1 Tax=Nepenthes gracilis TaxID=150966 RepID=A0AAD3Y4C7_NEPGR|nr:hypothetical protein Nepgr_030551 [Nepenthes gracilis]
MEENSAPRKRRNSVSSSVEIPTKVSRSFRRSSTADVNGHRYPSLSPPPLSLFSGVDSELVSVKSPTYISLKDLLPTSPSILSPTATAAAGIASSSSGVSAAATSPSLYGCEISIRNRLLKQAAWAYLQPMSSSPSASSRRLWRCFSGDFFKPLLASVHRWIVVTVTRVFNWLVDALWLILCR